MQAWLPADWPAPANIKAGCTLRNGGHSRAPYASFNLAMHVGDDPAAVTSNRQQLQNQLDLPATPVWLNQVHGNVIIRADAAGTASPVSADGSWSDTPGVVCAVLVADCLPLLLYRPDGCAVAAVHVGWRGLLAEVIESAVAALGSASTLLAWLGPAIGPDAFEVGDDVYAACRRHSRQTAAAFSVSRPGHWLADLPLLVRQRLAEQGVHQHYGGTYCTYSEPDRFYSYRRDGITGRQAALIWINRS
ncbi:MAG: peptidoglycan editing factor PgeF [Gammaproteobacteria bacterium]